MQLEVRIIILIQLWVMFRKIKRAKDILRQGGMTFKALHFIRKVTQGHYSIGKAFSETFLLFNLKWLCRCSSVSWRCQSRLPGARVWEWRVSQGSVSTSPFPSSFRFCINISCLRDGLSSWSCFPDAPCFRDTWLTAPDWPHKSKTQHPLLISPNCQALSSSGLLLILTISCDVFCFVLFSFSFFMRKVYSSTLSCLSVLLLRGTACHSSLREECDRGHCTASAAHHHSSSASRHLPLFLPGLPIQAPQTCLEHFWPRVTALTNASVITRSVSVIYWHRPAPALSTPRRPCSPIKTIHVILIRRCMFTWSGKVISHI